MVRVDKYGRGSAALNGGGFVDLVPGDAFATLKEQLKRRIANWIYVVEAVEIPIFGGCRMKICRFM